MAKTQPSAKEDVTVPNGRPWYIRTIEVVMSEKGMVAVFALVLLVLFVVILWQNHSTLKTTIEASQTREERNTQVSEDLSKSFKKIATTLETAGETQKATQQTLEALNTKAEIMGGVKKQRLDLHNERMELAKEQHVESMLAMKELGKEVIGSETAEALKDFSAVPSHHKKQAQDHEKASEERNRIQETVDRIEKKLP